MNVQEETETKSRTFGNLPLKEPTKFLPRVDGELPILLREKGDRVSLETQVYRLIYGHNEVNSLISVTAITTFMRTIYVNLTPSI